MVALATGEVKKRPHLLVSVSPHGSPRFFNARQVSVSILRCYTQKPSLLNGKYSLSGRNAADSEGTDDALAGPEIKEENDCVGVDLCTLVAQSNSVIMIAWRLTSCFIPSVAAMPPE
jgi:hypothetical protein